MAKNERALMALGLILASAGGKDLRESLGKVNAKIRDAQAKEPMSTAVAAVLAGAAVFYAAERGKNPKVNSYYDALVYVSTNLSVGYSDIFAKTPLGKLLGSALMTWGPALATRTFDPPAPAHPTVPASDAALQDLGHKLDAILNELKAARGPTGAL